MWIGLPFPIKLSDIQNHILCQILSTWHVLKFLQLYSRLTPARIHWFFCQIKTRPQQFLNTIQLCNAFLFQITHKFTLGVTVHLGTRLTNHWKQPGIIVDYSDFSHCFIFLHQLPAKRLLKRGMNAHKARVR